MLERALFMSGMYQPTKAGKIVSFDLFMIDDDITVRVEAISRANASLFRSCEVVRRKASRCRRRKEGMTQHVRCPHVILLYIKAYGIPECILIVQRDTDSFSSCSLLTSLSLRLWYLYLGQELRCMAE